MTRHGAYRRRWYRDHDLTRPMARLATMFHFYQWTDPSPFAFQTFKRGFWDRVLATTEEPA